MCTVTFAWINDFSNDLHDDSSLFFNLEFVDLFWLSFNSFRVYQSLLEISTISFFDLIFTISLYQFSEYTIYLYHFLDLVVIVPLVYNFYIDLLTPSLNFNYFIWFNSSDLYFIWFSLDFLKFLAEYSNYFNCTAEYDSFFINLSVYFIKSVIFSLVLVLWIVAFITTCPIIIFIFDSAIPFSFKRLLYFLLGVSFEYRTTTNFLFIFLFVFSWFFFLVFFSECLSNFVDAVHCFLFASLVFLIFFFLLRYSIHFFVFLEATDPNNLSISFLLKQFIRDCFNFFAFFLRFFLLVFRVNIYDSLDDFLDSYYIFLCDYDENFLFNELGLFVFNNSIFFTDNQNDSLLLEDFEFFNIFSFFFIFWGKFFFFICFLVEESFRLLLSIYIIYLILFEIHSTNISYKE